MAAYDFKYTITDPNHFVNRYIRYAKDRTDAPWDYHEAQALVLLSVATQGILWQLPSTPGGVATNLYILNHGRTSKAKKSTVMKIAKEIQQDAMPGMVVPENFTPGALEEIMEEHNGRPAIIWADEFKGHLERMYKQSYMAGVRQFLLTMYGERDWDYRRVNKGKTRSTKDMIQIRNAHLCLVGNTTPAVTETLTTGDVSDGFLARFGIIWPKVFPPLKGLRDMSCNESEKLALTKWLREIRDMAIGISELEGREPETRSTVIAEDEALDVFDEFQFALSRRADRYDDLGQSITQRLPAMSHKVAILCAVGRPGRSTADHVSITKEDAEWATKMMEKWENWAIDFVSEMQCGKFHKEILRSMTILKQHGGRLERRHISHRLKKSKREIDEIQSTLIDQGLIYPEEVFVNGSVKSTLFWCMADQEEEESCEAEA